jgi:hypothetical protein
MVEEDREPEGARGSRPGWIWLAIGLVLGAGSTVLLLRSDEPTALTPTTQDGDGLEYAEGIGGAIEDFPDGLIAVSRSEGRALELLVWPQRGEPIVRTIPVGDSRPGGLVKFDVSSRRIATLLPVPDQAHGVLYAGVPEQAAIVTTGVTGYAWHDAEPSLLAYTTIDDGELVLWQFSDPVADPSMVTSAVGIVGGVRAWGDWGFAIQDEERDSVVLLTDTGEIKATQSGRILDSDGAGWLAVADQGVTLLSSGGGVVSGPEGLDGQVIGAAFSPSGDEIALLEADRAIVSSLAEGTMMVESGERPGVPEIAWSSDGRFAAYPAARGIVVMDTAEGGSTQILREHVFSGLGVLPIETS